jgi:hypothetical protein
MAARSLSVGQSERIVRGWERLVGDELGQPGQGVLEVLGGHHISQR